MAAVGIVVNPWAGKDVRRLHAPTGHTPDTAKVGIVKRIALAALTAGADTVYVVRDVGRIAERAIAGVDDAVLVDGPGTGSALDTRRGAAQLRDLGCCPVVVLGGDGTCRDVTMGFPDATLIAVSTGTNNVFPAHIDGTSAGTAAGLIAWGAIDGRAVGRRAKVLHVRLAVAGEAPVEEIALVDVALVSGSRTGARAVVRADTIRAVVAAIASPASTGLSSIAGRLHPLGRDDDGAVVVRVGDGSRAVRAPIVPGSFDVLGVESLEVIADGGSTQLRGPGLLAYDGERDRVLPADAEVTITVRRDGPLVVDVERTLHCAAIRQLFDIVTAEKRHGH